MGNYVKKINSNQNSNDNELYDLLKQLIANNQSPQPAAPQLDASQIANVVAQAVSGVVENNLKNIQQSNNKTMYNSESESNKDHYDESKSLSKLAESMIIQRGENKSNFENLGGENLSKKDAKETQKTIDLLKDLDN